MADGGDGGRWRTDGKFFRSGGRRLWPTCVTYGPFPGGFPADLERDFRRIVAAGFDSIRLFEMPDGRFLDVARSVGLKVFGGLRWGQNADFLGRPGLFSAARVSLTNSLRAVGSHPALVGVYVGNEIPADLVRWMGPARVLAAVEDLIALGREVAPGLLFAYANYPSTDYLEPENADFTAFNIYLESPEAYRAYLRRLHHVAGDRPLVVSEFGLDSRRHGLERQAEVLAWAAEIARAEEAAGFTVYAWSDRWWNAGAEVTDWDFGLVDRQDRAKPALSVISCAAPLMERMGPSFSVIVCTRDGVDRIGDCLRSVSRLRDVEYETIVVDDGSGDGTADLVAGEFPGVILLKLEACGLSAARNAGAAVARGEVLAFTDDDCMVDAEWLARLRRVYQDGRFSAAGGPNLPPGPRCWQEAVVCAAPGAPSHVMLDDEEAEHLPGCNLSVRKEAFEAVGGFDPRFRTAGDDVDFCWRLRDAGHRLGFAPGAFVWHRRRPSLRAFLKQQAGYGRAERLLMEKHPSRFTPRGAAKWEGFVYGGGPVRVAGNSVIYHGPMGCAGYQSITNRMLPLRGLATGFDSALPALALAGLRVFSPFLRGWLRNRWRMQVPLREAGVPEADPWFDEITLPGTRQENLRRFLKEGWRPAGATDPWDASKPGARVLLADEYEADGSRHTLVRLWGTARLPEVPRDERP